MLVIILATIGLLSILPIVLAEEPNGATIDLEAPQRAPNDTVTSDTHAWAGNITEVNINAYSSTQTWQGYFGNVTGTIQLADSTDDVMYNWTLASPEGEVYASSNNTIFWTSIQCLNYTAISDYSDIAGGAGGTTSLFGTNLTEIERIYGINETDNDGVNETFIYSNEAGSAAGSIHDTYFTASQQFDAGECWSTLVYADTGMGESAQYQEALMYEPTTTSIVYAAILEEADTLGFDDSYHDFELMVLEDGHGTNVAETTYYFWVELE